MLEVKEIIVTKGLTVISLNSRALLRLRFDLFFGPGR